MTRPPGQKITSRASTYPEPVQGIWTWLRSHPWEADLALAALVFFASAESNRRRPADRVVSLCPRGDADPASEVPGPGLRGGAAIVAHQVLLGLRPQGGYNTRRLAAHRRGPRACRAAVHAGGACPRRVSVAGLVTCLSPVGRGDLALGTGPHGSSGRIDPGGGHPARQRVTDGVGARRLRRLPVPGRLLRRAGGSRGQAGGRA